MNAFLQDVRYALRQLRKNPGFAVTACLTLALAIGVTTVVFSVIYTVPVRPLPYGQSDRIFYLQTWSPQGYTQPTSYPEYLDWRRENHAFSALAGYSTGTTNFEGPSGPVARNIVQTTDNFFYVFGVSPILGRTFASGEEQPGRNDVVVLSYEVWRQDFGAQRGAIGQTIKLDGRPYSVVGIMPAGFRFPLATRNAVFSPLHITKQLMEGRGNHWLPVIARLKPDVSPQQAQAYMNGVIEGVARAFPDESKGRRAKLLGIADLVVGDTTGALKLLFFAVLALLTIGCVNIAGLLLARGVRREREIALRTAVGANRTRILRQVFTEALILALAGAMSGTLLAYGLLNLIRTLLISAVSRGADVQIDATVLLVALTASVVTSFLAVLIPALRLSTTAPNLALKSGGSTGTSRGQHHLRAGFIVTQVALALMLLVTSGLLLRTLAGLRNTDLGFNTDHLLTAEINLSRGTYEGRDTFAGFYQPLLERAQAIPGVQAAGIIQILPIQTWGWNSDVQIVGHPPNPPNQERLAEYSVATPGYFHAFGITLVRGRMFDEKVDTPTSAAVAVVNEAFVKKFLADGEDPIGKRIDDETKTTIIGIVRSIRQNIYQPPLAEMVFPVSQVPLKDSFNYLSSMQLVVRTSGHSETVIPSLRRIFHEVDSGIPFRQPSTMNEIVADVLIFERLENWLFSTFAALAVLLALVGLYGLVSHEVELSTRDIGLRVALGATRLSVLTTVYRRIGLMLLGGVATGLLTTFAVEKLIAAVVIVYPGRDIGVVFGITAGLFTAGLLSVLGPARRAASIDPMVALRYE
jgi:putative ABC transport system permease protein